MVSTLAFDKPVATRTETEAVPAAPLKAVVDALSRMRFGQIQLTVHDGRLVQVDVTERQRFT